MKLAILSSLLIALLAAIPVQDSLVSEVHPENAHAVEVIAAEAAAADAILNLGGEEEEEIPAFLDASLAKGVAGHGGRGQCVRRFASSESSSSDSCDCCDECNKVYYDWLDFYTSVPTFFQNEDSTGTWSYWNLTNPTEFIANDGSLITGCSGGVVDSKVFSKFQSGLASNTMLDHAKFWVYANEPVPIPPHGDVVVKWAANVQTFNTEEHPFPSAITERNDYRLANAQFTAFDNQTGFNFAFVVTNHRVYIMYQRTTEILEESAGLKSANAANAVDWAAFTFVIPVKIRRVCDWHDLEIVFHGDSKEVSYHVDDQEVFIINKVGYLLDRDYMTEDAGGLETATWPESIRYGFGTFTDLDHYPSCQRAESCRACRYPFIRQSLVNLNDDSVFTDYNPIFGPNTPSIYYVTSGADSEYKLWGQGVVTKIRKLIAYQRLPIC